MSKADINMRLTLENKELKAKLRESQKVVRQQGKQLQKSGDEVSKSFQGIDKNAGLAGAAVMSFGGVLSDAPYGIRGVANNLQQLGATFSMLVGKAGGVKGAFKSLLGQLAGPMGIMVAFQGAISLLQVFSANQGKAASASKQAAEETGAQAAKLRTLQNIYLDANSTLDERKDAFNSLKKEIPELTNLEYDQADAVNAVNAAITKSIQLDVVRAKQKILLDQLAKAQLELSDAIEEGNGKFTKFLDLFSGVGGMRVGTTLNTAKIIESGEDIKEIQEEINALYKKEFSLTDVTAKKVERKTKKEKERLDILKEMSALSGTKINMDSRGLEGIGAAMGLPTAEQIEVPFVEAAKKTEAVWIQMWQKVMGKAQDYFSLATMGFSLLNQLASNRMSAIDNEYEQRKKLIEENVGQEENKYALMQELDKEFEAKKRAEARKTAKLNKAQAVFDSIINTAVAVTKALPNVVLASFVGALGAAQTAAISAQPIPALAEGGLAYAPTLAMVGDNKGAATDPEVIAPLSKLGKMLGGGNITLNGRLRGSDIYLSGKRENKRMSRVG